MTCYLKGKKNVFLRNTTNKHRVIIVTLTELIKPWFDAFHSCYDATIGTAKLSVQSFLKCLITEISETKDLLVLLLQHAGHNSNHCTLKVTKSKIT